MIRKTLFLFTPFLWCGFSTALADSPPNITTDIHWTDTGGVYDPSTSTFDATFNGVVDIEAAYNNARRDEETQLGLAANCYGDLVLPTQAEWDAKSDSLKGLFIVNAERSVRAGLCGTDSLVLGLPFEDAEQHVVDVAQSYADVLLAFNVFQHTSPADGSSSSDRINNDPFIGGCNEFLAQVENLAAFGTSGTSNPLVIERSLYNFIYDDSGSAWGHRTAALLQDNTLAGNAWGYDNNNNSSSSEGYVGFGVASGQNYLFPGFFGTVVVMNMFDPIQESAICDFDTLTPTPTGYTELTHPDPASGDRFGYSVSIDGEYAVVGARLDDVAGFSNIGTAHVYKRDGLTNWIHVATLEGIQDGTADNDKFGHGVAISGNTIAVSAEADDDNGFRAGLVYLFEGDLATDTWTLIKTVASSNIAARDFFGRSIDISGDTLVVGAHVADPYGSASGSAYIFDRNQGGADNWGEVAILDPLDGAAGDIFGNAVSIDGDYVVVGAMRDDDSGLNSGSAYVFERSVGGANSWGLAEKLTGSLSMPADQFGYSVSISGDSVAVGARLADDEATELMQTGAVYVFTRDALGGDWLEEQRVTPDMVVEGNRFGAAVAIDGNRLLVGATHADDNGTDAGKAHYFTRTVSIWSHVEDVINPDVSTRDQYGVGVALDGQVGLVGAWLDNRPGNNSGGAYIHYLP